MSNLNPEARRLYRATVSRPHVLRFAVFLLVVLSIWGGMHLYAFGRLASLPWVAARAPRWALVVAAVVLGSLYLVGRWLDGRGLRAAGAAFELAGATWMGVLFLAFAALFAVDVGTLFGRLSGASTPMIRTGALALAAVFSVVATVQGLRAPARTEVEARLPGLPKERDGLRVVLASDLHLGTILGAKWLDARAAEIAALRPDLVVMCGDGIDGDVGAVAPLLPNLRAITAPLGVFAVTGNHEVYAGAERSALLMRSAGWSVLRDEWTEAVPGLVIAGVDDFTARGQLGANRGDPLARALDGRPPNAATILLSHTPWRADDAVRLGASLMLSGHTHAGQICPFGLLVKLQYPLLAGTYRVDGATVVVCRGTGTWGPRMRLFRRGEIVAITLRVAA
jgi:predicted MPP superfamily phosphohydrolase